jgi:putative hydrolase of the HAD superfamily
VVKALLFDLYDTLAHIDIDRYLAIKAEMAAILRLPADAFLNVWKRYTSISSLGEVLTIEERIARILRDLNVRPETEAIRDAALLEYKLQTEQVHLSNNVAEVLNCHRDRGIKLGLVTNAPSYMRSIPSILGIENCFDTVVFSFELGVLKPDPRIYLAACNNLELKPFECVFIGDGNDRELDGARRLGMISVIIGNGRSEILRSEQSQAYDYRIEKIEGLEEILNKIRLT